MSRRRSHGALRAAGLLVMIAVGVVTPTTARAQGAEEPPPRLVSQTTWVGPDEPFSLAFTVAGGLPDDGAVELTLYGALTEREVLSRGVQDQSELGPIRGTVSIPASIVPERAGGAFRLRLPTDGSGRGLAVDEPGVYPLAVALVDGAGVSSRPMLTFLVRADPVPRASRLAVALVLPLGAPPSTGPDGDTVLTDRTRRVMEVRADLLRRYPDVVVTVVPTPETLEALRRVDPALLEDVRGAVADDPVIAGPYVRLDLGAFAATSALAEPLDEQFEAGAATVRRFLRRAGDERTWVGLGSPTGAALDALADAGVVRALFRAESVSGPTVPIDAPVTVVGPTGQTLAAFLADPGLRAHVNRTADPVLSAQRALADLALLALPVGGGGVGRGPAATGVTFELPANRPLPAAFLHTLLAGLDEPGPVRTAGLAGLFTTGPSGGEAPEVQGVGLVSQELGPYSTNLMGSRRLVDSYVSFAGGANPTSTDLRRRLLVSGSADLTESRRNAYLGAVAQAIQNETAAVTITDDETVTLTSREGDIPVTIDNGTGAPVEVAVSFDSDNRLGFPEGAVQRIRLDEGPNRVDVPVVARASGAFPLRITVTAPDEVLTIGRAQLTVRSTVVSGVGTVLSIGAGVVLVVWWARHWRTTRRDRRLMPPPE